MQRKSWELVKNQRAIPDQKLSTAKGNEKQRSKGNKAMGGKTKRSKGLLGENQLFLKRVHSWNQLGDIEYAGIWWKL